MKSWKSLFFMLFFLSGFCGLLYQVVWLRMAFASFGVITPVLSIVISVFMLGLAIGSWLAGRWVLGLSKKTRQSPLLFYGLVELLIGLGAFAVPFLFHLGENYLMAFSQMDSTAYLFVSALLLLVILLPWCTAMGATYPLVMAAIKKADQKEETSFSFLYLSNVIGAMCGTTLTALVLIELLGFSNTLIVAALVNFFIGSVSLWMSQKQYAFVATEDVPPQKEFAQAPNSVQPTPSPSMMSGVLFVTGFTSMAMEVVWTRGFTPVMKTTIYAFAFLLAVFLLATWIGSYLYRRHESRGHAKSLFDLLLWLALASIIPLLVNDPRFHHRMVLVLMSIVPFCGILGYLTPQLIDKYSLGYPDRAGRAYAINILGCILGPLCAGYILLPLIGVKWSLLLLASPFAVLFVAYAKRAVLRSVWLIVLIATFGVSATLIRTYEDGQFYKEAQVRRDHTATVIAYGEGLDKRLLVNGIGITNLTPITKIMAHLPLAMKTSKPERALVICFGMGTTFRSLMSWGIEVVAVELVPSVYESFPFFFEDAPALLRDPKGQIVIDDGRRYLKRTRQSFDVITIDPPPPVEAAGSSLLYSVEFYQDVKSRLKPTGILQQWFPGGDEKILFAVARSITKVFPHVRVYHSIENWGYHFIASSTPFDTPSEQDMLSRLPERAKKDLLEWYPNQSIAAVVRSILSKEISIQELLKEDATFLISDNQPLNEYYLLRRTRDKLNRTISKE
jgi:spermidine synthase